MARCDASGPATRRGLCLAVVVAGLGLLAASCAGSDSATPTPTTTSSVPSTSGATSGTGPETTSPATSTTAVPAEEEIVARYLGFWDARLAANSGTPDPDDPALAEFATGEQLQTVIAETRRRREEGLALRAAEPSRTEHIVTVVSRSGDRAELQDCFVNDGVVYRVATGEVVDDSVVTRNVLAVMVKVDGLWKLQRASVVQEWEGVAGCAGAR